MNKFQKAGFVLFLTLVMGATACSRASDTPEPQAPATAASASAMADKDKEAMGEKAMAMPDKAMKGEAMMGMAADAPLVSADGTPLQMASLWQDGPAIVVFYRGHWCGYCRKQFKDLQARLGEVTAAGGKLVAVSVDADDPKLMMEKTGVNFSLYADPTHQATKTWGAYDADNEIAHPATFVVDGKGHIVYRYVGESKDDRPAFDDALAALEKLQG